jgi:hypothetical protein
MAWKVLKQFTTECNTVWVEKLSADDTVDVYNTEAEAETKKSELESSDNSRQYKIVEI